MTCWAASAAFGPRSAGTKKMSSATSGLAPIAVRQAEIELRMYDAFPAIRAWLLEAGTQEKTSLVADCFHSRVMNSTAATVSSELMTTRSSASCSDAPYDHISARAAMLESVSWDRPIPQGMFLEFLISVAPRSRSSQLDGPLGSPAA